MELGLIPKRQSSCPMKHEEANRTGYITKVFVACNGKSAAFEIVSDAPPFPVHRTSKKSFDVTLSDSWHFFHAVLHPTTSGKIVLTYRLFCYIVHRS